MNISFNDRTQAWVETAEAIAIPLQRSAAYPVRRIAPVADPTSFLGWSCTDAGPPEEPVHEPLRQGACFCFDFGEHVVGYLKFEASLLSETLSAPLRLKLTFGEEIAEIAEALDPYTGNLSRSWLQDEIVNIDVIPAVVALPRRYAFRYLKVEVLGVFQSDDLYLSSFVCETVTSAPAEPEPLPPAIGDRLRQIDEVSLRTLRNCMHTVFEDGPKRDRRLWIGDFILEAQTNYVSFRNFDLAKRCLYLFAGLVDDAGRMPACVYELPEPHRGADYILDYALSFGPALLDYAEAVGDWETAAELLPVALRQLAWGLEYVNDDGLFVDPGNCWIHIDWNPALDKQASMQGLLIDAMRRTLALAERVGLAREAEFLSERIDRMTRAARSYLLDEDSGLYVSGERRQLSWSSQIYMLLSGTMTAAEGARAFRLLADRDDAVKPSCPLLYHYLVEALFRCGMRAEAVALLESYWGGMIRQGATTFWEVYDPDSLLFSNNANLLMDSRCHGWGCTPSYFIRRFLVSDEPGAEEGSA